ncbi:24892_t:CDS:2, partial [Gigaspora rosea]
TQQDPNYTSKGLTSSCGYIYVVVDCDNVAKIKEEEVTKCSNCKKVVGAIKYSSHINYE